MVDRVETDRKVHGEWDIGKNVLNYLFWLVEVEDIVSFCAPDSG